MNNIIIDNLELKKLKDFNLGDYIPTSSISAELSTKYSIKYFPENTLVTDDTANVYKNIKCSKITKKVFDKRAGNNYDIIIRTSCISKKIEGLVVVGADMFPSMPDSAENHYAGGVYISLDGGETYTLFDADPDNTPDDLAKICGICSIREEQNFVDRHYEDILESEYKYVTAFVCGNNKGELFEMLVYVTESGELLETCKHLYYISGRFKCTKYSDLVDNTVSIKSFDIGTVFDIDFIDGKYVLATRSGIWAYYIDESQEIPVQVVKTYSNCAAYTAIKYNDKVYSAPIPTVQGTPGRIISTTDGLSWTVEYTILNINNLNKLLTFDNKLVGVGQNNYVLTYDKTEWKETSLEIEGDFNSNSTTSLYMSKLRKERCFMASDHGLYMSDTLTKWTNINNDSSIAGDTNQGHSLFLYGDYLYLCGRGITQLEDALKPLATKDECMSQEAADAKYLAKTDALTTYLTKTSANELYMDAVLSSHEEQVHYYEWKISDDLISPPIVIRSADKPSDCKDSQNFIASVNDNAPAKWSFSRNGTFYYSITYQDTNVDLHVGYTSQVLIDETVKNSATNKAYAVIPQALLQNEKNGTIVPATGAEATSELQTVVVTSKANFADAALSVIYDENDVTRKVAKGICLGDISNSNVYKLYIDNGEIKTQQM